MTVIEALKFLILLGSLQFLLFMLYFSSKITKTKKDFDYKIDHLIKVKKK